MEERERWGREEGKEVQKGENGRGGGLQLNINHCVTTVVQEKKKEM